MISLDKKDAARKAVFTDNAYAMYATGELRPPPAALENAGYDLLFWLNAHDISEQKFYGYIAVSRADPGEYVLSIRGTQTFQEWLLDFASIPVPFKAAPHGGFVALGFVRIFESFEFIEKATGASMSLAGAAASLRAVKSLLITGHSLGAALATLAAAQLAMNNTAGLRDKILSMTFASPRVGLRDFAQAFNESLTSHRIWNALDIVPEFPTFPFIHVGGHGDRLIQTEQQLTALTITPGCEHSLFSYQWLLDPFGFALEDKCASFGRMGPKSVPDPGQAAGRRAMAEALAENP